MGDDRSLVVVQVGIDRITLGGAETQLRFWGTKTANSHDLVRGIDFGALGYAGGHFADPAIYGVPLGIKF